MAGGTNWGSLSFDPERGVVVLNMTRAPFSIKLIPREGYEEYKKAVVCQETERKGQRGKEHSAFDGLLR